MKATNVLEQMVLDLVNRGELLGSLAEDIYMEMKFREMEEQYRACYGYKE